MTLQTLGHPIELPHRPKGVMSNGATAFSAIGTIDANGEKIAQCTLLTKAGNVSKVHFRTGAVTTGDDVLVRLETVSGTTGDPTGTLWGANTSATVTVGGGDSDTWKTATLTSAATINSTDVGKPIAVVVAAPAAGYTGVMEIDYAESYFTSGRTSVDASAWIRNYLTGAWVDDGYNHDDSLAVRLEYDDGTFPYVPSSYTGDANPSAVAFDVNTTPDEVGIKVRFPFAFRASGIWMGGLHVREDCAFKVYDASDVEQVTLPTWYRAWMAIPSSYKGTIFVHGPSFTVAANAWYRITCAPSTDDGTNVVAYYVPQATAAHWGAWGLDQDDFKWTERTNAGAWTDRDARLLFGGFIADQLHDGAGGGGGGVRNPFGGPV